MPDLSVKQQAEDLLRTEPEFVKSLVESVTQGINATELEGEIQQAVLTRPLAFLSRYLGHDTGRMRS